MNTKLHTFYLQHTNDLLIRKYHSLKQAIVWKFWRFPLEEEPKFCRLIVQQIWWLPANLMVFIREARWKNSHE